LPAVRFESRLFIKRKLNIIIAAFSAAFLFFAGCAHLRPGVSSDNSDKAELTRNSGAERPVPDGLKKTSVILVGETHYYTPPESYDYLLKTFVSGPKFCLAVEFPKSQGSFDVSLAELKKQIGIAKAKKREADDIRRMENVYRAYQKIYLMAQRLHVSVYGIDNKDHYASNLDVEQRNEEMSKNISDLLYNGQCERIMAILGKAHLTFGLGRKATVKSLLLAKEVAGLSVNLQMTNEDGVPYPYQSFENSGFEAPKGEFRWIENVSVQKMVRVLPHIENDLSVWQECDWTLLIPETFRPQSL
jgi:hypothetical protein